MRKIISSIILTLLIFSLVTGCAKRKLVKETKKTETERISSLVQTDTKKEKNIVMDITSSADWLYLCDSVEDLNSHSDAILTGTVQYEKSLIDDSCTIYTVYDIKVDKVYKGNVSKDDIITISRLGGTILAKDYFRIQSDPKAEEAKKEMENDPENTYVRFSFDGSWQPESGNQYVWFLDQDDTNGESDFEPVNVYQGIFKIDGDYVNRYSVEKDDNSITNKKKNLPNGKITISDLEKQIQDALKDLPEGKNV